MPDGNTSLAERFYAMPVLLLALCMLFWAGNAVASRIAVGEISPMMLTQLRWVLVIAVLLPLNFAALRDGWDEIRPRLPMLIVTAGLGFTGFNALYYIAAHHTSAVNLGILQGSIPVLVLLGSYFVYGVRTTLLQVLGVIVTLAGVVVIATQGDIAAALAQGMNFGDLAMLLACALYAIYTVALRDRPKLPGVPFFTLLAIVATVTSMPLVAIEYWNGALVWPTHKGWLITLYVAVFPSCLAQIFFLRGVELIGPGRAGVYINLVPVFSALLGVLLINEPFGIYHAAALALVLLGISLAQRSPAAKAA